MEERIHITTTQNVGIDYEVASLGIRYVAGMIDAALLLGYVLFFVFLIENYNIWLPNWLYYILLFMPIFLYDLLMEFFFNGQSLGKYAMGLRVVNLDGSQATLGSFLLRFLLRPIDVMLSMGGVAVVSIVVTGTGQRLGDLAAGTTVVSLKNKETLHESFFTMPPPHHQITFDEVNRLTDKDIDLIREIYKEADELENNQAVQALALRVAEVMNVYPELPARYFLNTVLADYYHLHSGAI
ncbi:MAG TPA: RDD family protein [Chitinophagales bacterium]|nr:RDD family protein [Chitinophagales bacterium]HRK29093.1 RDD family protein [Chitinophagales bacterium]